MLIISWSLIKSDLQFVLFELVGFMPERIGILLCNYKFGKQFVTP